MSSARTKRLSLPSSSSWSGLKISSWFVILYPFFKNKFTGTALYILKNYDISVRTGKTVKYNGRISIAHGMSKKELDEIHMKSAGRVSNILPECDELAELLSPYFNVDIKISNDKNSYFYFLLNSVFLWVL